MKQRPRARRETGLKQVIASRHIHVVGGHGESATVNDVPALEKAAGRPATETTSRS